MGATTLIVISGVSGVGKTTACQDAGVNALALDSFYLPEAQVRRAWLGRPDWEHIDTYDVCGAVKTIEELLEYGESTIPVYDHSQNRRCGTMTFFYRGRALVVEGVFGPEVARALNERGHEFTHFLLVRSSVRLGIDRVFRDVEEKRLPLWYSIARSARLAVSESSYDHKAKSTLAISISPEQLVKTLRTSHVECKEASIATT